jgi:hypothetical protein
MLAFAALGIGADFRERRPLGTIGADHHARLSAEHPEIRIYNEDPGVTAYPSDPPAVFFDFSAEGVVGKQGDRVVDVVRTAAQKLAVLDERLRLAYDLFSGSFSQPAADARFMMLSTALETIIVQEARSADALRLIDVLIETVSGSTLNEQESNSLIGALRSLCQESVGHAGRRLAARLDDRTFMGRTPVRVFHVLLRSAKCPRTWHLPAVPEPIPVRDACSEGAFEWAPASTQRSGNFAVLNNPFDNPYGYASGHGIVRDFSEAQLMGHDVR